MLVARRFGARRAVVRDPLPRSCALFPRFVGLAQLDPKDIPALAAATWAIDRILRLAEEPGPRAAALCGLAIGVCAGCSLFALSLPVVLAIALALTPGRPRARFAWFGIAVGVAAVVTFAGWPLLWHEPGYVIATTRTFAGDFWHGGGERYFGTLYAGDELPWHYTITHLLMSTPIAMLAAVTFGATRVRAIAAGPRERRALIVLAAWFLIPLVLTSWPGITRYGGIRHIVFGLAPWLVLAGFGIDAVIERLRRRVAIGVLALATLEVAIEIARWHPYADSYYNELVRAAVPEHLERELRIDESLSAYREAVAWVNVHAKYGARMAMECEWLRPSYRVRPDIGFDADQPDYVIAGPDPRGGVAIGIHWTQRAADPHLQVAYEVTRLGITFAVVLHRDNSAF